MPPFTHSTHFPYLKTPEYDKEQGRWASSDYFCCLLPYTSRIREIQIYVRLQICMKKPWSIF